MRRSALKVAGSARPLGRAATSVSSSSSAATTRSFASVRDLGAKVCYKLFLSGWGMGADMKILVVGSCRVR